MQLNASSRSTDSAGANRSLRSGACSTGVGICCEGCRAAVQCLVVESCHEDAWGLCSLLLCVLFRTCLCGPDVGKLGLHQSCQMWFVHYRCRLNS